MTNEIIYGVVSPEYRAAHGGEFIERHRGGPRPDRQCRECTYEFDARPT
jgi:hypothetical protein